MKLIKLPSIFESLTSLSLAFGSFQLPTWRPLRFLSESSFLMVLILNNVDTHFSVTSWVEVMIPLDHKITGLGHFKYLLHLSSFWNKSQVKNKSSSVGMTEDQMLVSHSGFHTTQRSLYPAFFCPECGCLHRSSGAWS